MSALCLGSATWAGAPATEGLPFAAQITVEKIENLPDYMGGSNPVDMDFPFCPVMIDGEYWVIYLQGYDGGVCRYKGTNIEDCVRQPDGKRGTPRGMYILGGLWYCAEEKKLYAPLHAEVKHYHGKVRREIHLATSTDKGLTWKYEGPLLTSDADITRRRPIDSFSGLTWDGGDGDHYIYVDERGGYIYLFSNHYIQPKVGAPPSQSFLRHRVARSAIKDRMAPGSWKRFYQGAWNEPGLGGKASYVAGYAVMYNTFLKKYLSFSHHGSLAVCDDLATQAWLPPLHMGPYWCSGSLFGFWATATDRANTTVGAETLFVYSFWMKLPGRRVRLDLSAGRTPGTAGLVSPSLRLLSPVKVAFVTTADPATGYLPTPLFESADPIEARRARRVPATSPEVIYEGAWSDKDGDRSSTTVGNKLRFSFTGDALYWRALKGPEAGMAEVAIDGKIVGTVDLWASAPDSSQFALVATGLDPTVQHQAVVTVHANTGGRGTGTAVRHLEFEHGADTYRASDGYSSVPGKNQWFNQERDGTNYFDMAFQDPNWKGAGGTEIGYFHLRPGPRDAVRKWIAPHDGSIRVEGAITGKAGVGTAIAHDEHVVWPEPTDMLAAHNLVLVVKKGDAITFAARRLTQRADKSAPGLPVNETSPNPADLTVTWDPVITYVDHSGSQTTTRP
jgi:hypothetical protein